MELGRECLEIWGYKIMEEIVWVKINQLQRIIRTGSDDSQTLSCPASPNPKVPCVSLGEAAQGGGGGGRESGIFSRSLTLPRGGGRSLGPFSWVLFLGSRFFSDLFFWVPREPSPRVLERSLGGIWSEFPPHFPHINVH